MIPVKNKLTLVYALSGLLAALLVVSSIVGLLYGRGGFYDSYPASLAGLVGQDGITLVVGIPLLVASMWLSARGSMSGLFLWAGALFYFAYSYYFYVVGGFLIGISLLFVLMWGGMSVSSAAAGARPEKVLREVVIIDCTVLLPLLFFGGLRLWRREAWGYVLGGLLLVKALATGSTLAVTTALGAWWAGAINPFDAFLFVLFALMAIGALLLLVLYLRSVEEEGGRRANLR